MSKKILKISVFSLILFLPAFIEASDSLTQSNSITIEGQVLDHITYIKEGNEVVVTTNLSSGVLAYSDGTPVHIQYRSENNSFQAQSFILSPNL